MFLLKVTDLKNAPSLYCLLAGNKRAHSGRLATSIEMIFLGFPFLIVCRSAGKCKRVNIWCSTVECEAVSCLEHEAHEGWEQKTGRQEGG